MVVTSVAYCETPLNMPRPLDLVEDRGGEVLVRDPAPAIGVEQKLIATDAETARALTGVDVRRRARIGPAPVRDPKRVEGGAVAADRDGLVLGYPEGAQ